MDNKDRGVVPLSAQRATLEKKLSQLGDPLEGLSENGGEVLRKLIGRDVVLHLRSGLVLPCRLGGVSKFEMLVTDGDGKRLLVFKHAIDWLEVQRP